jgi:hypothetical protein
LQIIADSAGKHLHATGKLTAKLRAPSRTFAKLRALIFDLRYSMFDFFVASMMEVGCSMLHVRGPLSGRCNSQLHPQYSSRPLSVASTRLPRFTQTFKIIANQGVQTKKR